MSLQLFAQNDYYFQLKTSPGRIGDVADIGLPCCWVASHWI